MYFLRIEPDERIFVRTVLDGFEQLRRAAKGKTISAHLVLGFAGVTLAEGTEIATPWGTVRPAPKPRPDTRYVDPWQSQTTSLLIHRITIPVKIDHAASPDFDYGSFDLGIARSQVLFPLACTLSSKESAAPVVPRNTWWSLLLPFQIGNVLFPVSDWAECEVRGQYWRSSRSRKVGSDSRRLARNYHGLGRAANHLSLR